MKQKMTNPNILLKNHFSISQTPFDASFYSVLEEMFSEMITAILTSSSIEILPRP